MKRSFKQMDSKYDFYKKKVRDDFINKNINHKNNESVLLESLRLRTSVARI